MASAQLQPRFVEHFKSSLFMGSKHRLLLLLSRTLLLQLLLPIIPRLVLLRFTLSQPFFIESLIGYLARPAASVSANTGYGLIGASSLIYSGIALSTALHWYFHYRMLYMARRILVSSIYAKTMEAKSGGDGNASLTLMSTGMYYLTPVTPDLLFHPCLGLTQKKILPNPTLLAIERINQGFRS